MNPDSFKRLLEDLAEKITTIHSDVKVLKKNFFVDTKDRVLDIPDVAHILKISERQVKRLIQEEKLKGFKLGNRRLFLMGEILDYIESLLNSEENGEG